MSRPEHSTAPAIFYDETEARKYSSNSRMNSIQREITSRALELLNINPNDPPKLLLDVGCGSGLSGQVISEHGHYWVGMDISPSMLQVAQEGLLSNNSHSNQEGNDDGDEDEDEDDAMEEEEEDDNDDDDNDQVQGEGDLILRDMGHGLNFRSNTFDGCISISAVQWLCNAYDKTQVPMQRLRTFFTTLYQLLRKGSRAVIQVYPESPAQMEQITNAAMQSGFTGGVVVDYPNSAKAKKYYLVIFAGGEGGNSANIPKALGTDSGRVATSVDFEKHRNGDNKKRNGRIKSRDSDKLSKKSKDWIEKKKDRQRKQGKDVRPNSKFTGRKRSAKF